MKSIYVVLFLLVFFSSNFILKNSLERLGPSRQISSQQSTCADLSNFNKNISPSPFDLEGLLAKAPGYEERAVLESWAWENKIAGFFNRFYKNYELFCGNVLPDDQMKCKNLMLGTLKDAISCFGTSFPVESNRAIFSAYTRIPEFQEIVYIPILVTEPSNEIFGCREKGGIKEQKVCVQSLLPTSEKNTFQKRSQLLEEFGVFILAPGIALSKGEYSQEISAEGLERLIEGYKLMKQISTQIGIDLSHLWGAGGLVVRTGEVTVNGQFGQVDSNNPLMMKLVMDPSKETRKNGKVSKPKSAPEIAERIAHENFHAKDFLDGILSYRTISWSERHEEGGPARIIFRECGNSSLRSCRARNPKIFSFSSSSYPATDVYEFYASMVNVWIRDRLQKRQSRYACSGESNKELWHEMETQLLGAPYTQCR